MAKTASEDQEAPEGPADDSSDVREDGTHRPPMDEEQDEGGEIAASAYYSDHNLREMFSRENAERRRQGAKTLRKYLSAKQDKQVMNKMVRIRDEYDVRNNDDVILAWAKMMIEEGKAEDIHPRILETAEKAELPKRTEPVYPDDE